MKKFLTLICCFCFILTGAVLFTACGGTPEDKNPAEISKIIDNTAKYIELDSAANLNVDDEWFNYENKNYKETSHLNDYIGGNNGLLKLLNDWYRNDYNESLFKKTLQKNECYFKLTSDSIYAYRDNGETLESLKLAFVYSEHAAYEGKVLQTRIYYAHCNSSLTTFNVHFNVTPLDGEMSEIIELDIDYATFKEAISHNSLPYIKANIFDSYTYQLLDWKDFWIDNRETPELDKFYIYSFRQGVDNYSAYSFDISRNEKRLRDLNQRTDDSIRSWQYYTIQEFSDIVEDVLA